MRSTFKTGLIAALIVLVGMTAQIQQARAFVPLALLAGATNTQLLKQLLVGGTVLALGYAVTDTVNILMTPTGAELAGGDPPETTSSVSEADQYPQVTGINTGTGCYEISPGQIVAQGSDLWQVQYGGITGGWSFMNNCTNYPTQGGAFPTLQYRSAQQTCPAGYTEQSGSCILVDAELAGEAADDICDYHNGAIRENDPDCTGITATPEWTSKNLSTTSDGTSSTIRTGDGVNEYSVITKGGGTTHATEYVNKGDGTVDVFKTSIDALGNVIAQGYQNVAGSIADAIAAAPPATATATNNTNVSVDFPDDYARESTIAQIQENTRTLADDGSTVPPWTPPPLPTVEAPNWDWTSPFTNFWNWVKGLFPFSLLFSPLQALTGAPPPAPSISMTVLGQTYSASLEPLDDLFAWIRTGEGIALLFGAYLTFLGMARRLI